MKAWFVHVFALAMTHPIRATLLVVFSLYALSGIVNWRTAQTLDAWEVMKVERPRRAGFVMLVRALGFCPSHAWRGAYAAIVGRFPGKGPPVAPSLVALLVVSIVTALVGSIAVMAATILLVAAGCGGCGVAFV